MFKGGAGALNRRITLQRLPDPDGPKNDFGELLAGPVNDIEDIRAAYEAVGTRAFPDREKRYQETTARFRIRYRPGLDIQALPLTHEILYAIDARLSPPLRRRFRITGADDPTGQRFEIHIEVSEIR